MRIFFVGNSFTFFNDLPGMFRTLCREAGVEVETGEALKGGAYLHQFADPEHECGKRLKEAYSQGTWDVLVLQDQSKNPAVNPADFLRAAEILTKLPAGRIVFYSTWAYREGTALLNGTGMTYSEMLTKLDAAYQTAAERFDAARIPVGDGFAVMKEIAPDVPMYCEDNLHPLPTGTYLAACLLFKRLTGRKAAELTTPDGMDEETAAILRQTADRF